MTLILSASDLSALADMEATIDAVERSFADLGASRVCQPASASMHLAQSDARYLVMAGASAPARAAAAGVKIGYGTDLHGEGLAVQLEEFALRALRLIMADGDLVPVP